MPHRIDTPKLVVDLVFGYGPPHVMIVVVVIVNVVIWRHVVVVRSDYVCCGVVVVKTVCRVEFCALVALSHAVVAGVALIARNCKGRCLVL